MPGRDQLERSLARIEAKQKLLEVQAELDKKLKDARADSAKVEDLKTACKRSINFLQWRTNRLADCRSFAHMIENIINEFQFTELSQEFKSARDNPQL